ncbi:probable RNA-dependent RNA polymerase 5 isoform X1 [Daucus carota subsp. sativus]|uniref:probable RNA-dependent RNA polymerase 5 isoform X1 n=1 Tax=Daucus carota subsp. sativus TaxID=79200 RepID=UPI0007EF10A4|nr:PREDICTED: probable RNA-dependent RNA polymerase 5 isoform X1 [Daucus carota subsp. sativus]
MSSRKRRLDNTSLVLEPRKHTVTSTRVDIAIPRAKDRRVRPCFLSKKAKRLLLHLSELEFRKAFLLFSYIGRNNIVDIMSFEDAVELVSLTDLPMETFEEYLWSKYGRRYLGEESLDRINHHDWDSRRTNLFYCYVYQDGTYSFKGPYLDTTRTHLQRALGDENILIVRFHDCDISISDYDAMCTKIAEEGILVGWRLYRHFGFKDGGREEKRKNPSLSSVKFYFVWTESIVPSYTNEAYILENRTIQEARSLFMHIHMTPSMAKYASRFSLILSKTIKLQVDLDSVLIEVIEDIPCCDQNGCHVYEDGERLIHTDGTGYIAEDLAMKCPKDIFKAKYMKDQQFEIKKSAQSKYHVREPPLLIQCRLFKNGLAVKGTLLVNKKLRSGTIQIRRSMIKVEADSTLPTEKCFNSLEVVAVSHKPKRCTLSKNLIALLSFGGVPEDFFLNLLQKALEETRIILLERSSALKFLMKLKDRDNVGLMRRMLVSGIALDEPCLQHCLTHLASEENKRLQRGKLPISESYYLMGTADPTGLLENDQVCVILGDGQVTGDVLVYRNPGLHFGDIHVLKATYLESIADFVGNAKYAIFFSAKGLRPMAKEIGDGDLDGDMYWVSKNPKLLGYFRSHPPWKRTFPAGPHVLHSKVIEFSSEQLEQALMQQYLIIRRQSNNIAAAADSWLAYMDRLLILGDNNPSETEHMKKTMLHLIEIYYNALDAAKSGKKVDFPNELKAELYPHHMERTNIYASTSVLGLIYDAVQRRQTQSVSVEDTWERRNFKEAKVPHECLKLWRERYKKYKEELYYAVKSDEFQSVSVDNIILKYKQMLYGAEELDHSKREMNDIYNDALAIHNVVYDYAKSVRDAGKCLFAWQVAGDALCKFYGMKEK